MSPPARGVCCDGRVREAEITGKLQMNSISRRDLAAGVGAILAVAAAPLSLKAAGTPLADRLAAIEAAVEGRLGVGILDAGSGAFVGYRAHDRFPLCSTFKALVAAAVLAKVDAGREQLDRRIRFTAADLVTYSPVTKDRVETGASLADLCEAAVTLSDNTAGNLLLAAVGGPAGLTAYLRGLGDKVTRLDRIEPFLNEAVPGDLRDTTTPAAMAATLQRLACGDALSQPSRERLTGWLVGCKTGDARLRAGVPSDWRVGDKTGGGERGSTNDVAVLWPPGRAPMVVTAYLTETAVSPERRNDALAAVGRAVAERVER
jgi:beta-lactamase class A